MVSRDTYAEYCQLRLQCGFHPDLAMIRSVWEGCDAEAQENMLNQFRAPAAARAEADLVEIVAEERAKW